MPHLLPERSVSERLAYGLYDLVGLAGVPLLVVAAPLLAWRGHTPGLLQRLGKLPRPLGSLAARPLWVHAASVGEMLSAAPLVDVVRARRPGLPILVSSTTLTGQAVALESVRPDAATLLPVDALRIVDRALRRVRPRCIAVVETEIWPGLLRAARRLEIPVVVVSGRLSARSLRRYRWARPLIRSALSAVARFGMQTAADAERIIALGAPPERVEITGSLKASRTAQGDLPPPVEGLQGRCVLVAASTHPGEEDFVLEACNELWPATDLLLVIAPRRPERFDEVERLVQAAGRRYVRRTRMSSPISDRTEVLILDTIGELARFFAAARAVLVGGTVAPVGGHNVLEPAAYGRAISFGPQLANVVEAAEALRAGGGAELVRTPAELARHWREMIERPARAAEMGARARAVSETRAAAVERTWELIAPFLGGG